MARIQGIRSFFLVFGNSFLRGLRVFAVIGLSLGFAVLFPACGKKSRFTEHKLPMPPAADTGVYDGQFVQVDYGFGFPAPGKWLYVRIVGEPEADEVGRFTDQARESIARVSVRLSGPDQKFSAKGWFDAIEQEWTGRQYKVKKREGAKELKTPDGASWSSALFRVSDSRGIDWLDQEWVLSKDDLILGVRALVPKKTSDTEKGQALLKSIVESLPKLSWYTPIGPRGVSLERFELGNFTERFCRSLESGSLPKTYGFFDEMYPGRVEWNKWYQDAVGSMPAESQLKAELSGLVINGDGATAFFTLSRADKGQSSPKKFEKGFLLSKKEGNWEIVSSLPK